MGGKIEIIWCEMGNSDSRGCVVLEKVQDGGRPILQLYYEVESLIRSQAFNLPSSLLSQGVVKGRLSACLPPRH